MNVKRLRAWAFVLLCWSLGVATVAAQAPIRIVYGLTLSVSGFDPHINQSSELGIVLRQVYDTLVYRDPASDGFVAGLATSWEISPDSLEYTFTLREGVTFHDGTPFNAQAVAANLDRILDPAIASQKAHLLLGPFSRYEILSDNQIKLVLSAPYTPFLDGLSQVYLGIASPTQLAAYANDPILYQFHQIGTGPFMFMEYLPEDRIVLRRNPDYTWGPTFYAETVAGNVDEIEFRWFTDPATRLLALENGDAQIIGEILPADARAAASNPNIVLEPVVIPGQPMQFYMNTNQPPTNQIAFRQALIQAVNRTAIVEAVYQGFSPVAWGPLTTPTDYYAASVYGAYNYDVSAAMQLLDSIGVTDTNGDGLREANGEPVTITLIQPPWGLVPEVTQFLQTQWREIGISTRIVAVPGFTGLLDQVNGGEFNLVEFESSGRDPALLNTYFHSEGVNNWTGFRNPDLDALLDQAISSSDPTMRANLYERIQIGIMQQALVMPVRDVVNINGYVKGISGLTYDPYGWFPLFYGVSYNPDA